jgi:hypothetical protein
MDLGKFNPDDFETHETVFINLLAQTYGAQGENLKYIVRDVVIPAEFVDDAEWRMYQLPLTGKAYSMDNKSVYHLLKSFLVNTSGWTWIELYDTMENGRRAFLAWMSHYNGQGELSKRTAMAKARVKSLFYKNEHSLSFEKVMEILSKSFSTLDKDPDERYSECQKVEELLQYIQMPDMEVVAQKSVIASQYANDFSGACNYFSAQVSRLHGGAQLENSKYTKSVMCLLCMVAVVETVVKVEDVVTLEVVVLGLVAMMEVALVDKVEVVMAGQILLMALMYQTQLSLCHSLLSTAMMTSFPSIPWGLLCILSLVCQWIEKRITCQLLCLQVKTGTQ